MAAPLVHFPLRSALLVPVGKSQPQLAQRRSRSALPCPFPALLASSPTLHLQPPWLTAPLWPAHCPFAPLHFRALLLTPRHLRRASHALDVPVAQLVACRPAPYAIALPFALALPLALFSILVWMRQLLVLPGHIVLKEGLPPPPSQPALFLPHFPALYQSPPFPLQPPPRCSLACPSPPLPPSPSLPGW